MSTRVRRTQIASSGRAFGARSRLLTSGMARRATALLTLVAFVAPIVTPTLAAAQSSGEPLEQVTESDWAQPTHTFDVVPNLQPDVGPDNGVGDNTTRDPNLHAPDDS